MSLVWDHFIHNQQASVLILRGALSQHDHLLDEFIKMEGYRQEKYNFGGREVLAPRLTKFYADPGVSYTYSGAKQEVWPWSDLTAALKTITEAITGWQFNSLLVNYYRNGNDSVGWHADDEPEVGPSENDRKIASLSFGTPRRFELKRNSDGLQVGTVLNSGDLLVMQGNTQSNYKHRVPKEKYIQGPRINLTFRSLV